MVSNMERVNGEATNLFTLSFFGGEGQIKTIILCYNCKCNMYIISYYVSTDK